MKYIKTFESHRNSKSVETEKPVNEEFFLGALGKMIGNLFKKAKERINKTKVSIELCSLNFLTFIFNNFF